MPAPVMAKAKAPARASPMGKNMKSPPFKRKSAPNGSILSFFKKEPLPEESMFVSGLPDCADSTPSSRGGDDKVFNVDEPAESNCEFSVSVKRQKLDAEQTVCMTSDVSEMTRQKGSTLSKPSQRGPFLDDSDSDEDESPEAEPVAGKEASVLENGKDQPEHLKRADSPVCPTGEDSFDALLQPLALAADADAKTETFGDDDFGDSLWDNLDEDDNFDGEEFRERRFMEEQGQLEAAEARDALSRDGGQSSVASCPICGTSLAGSTSSEATVHVNGCLDGLADETPPAAAKEQPEQEASSSNPEQKQQVSAFAARFNRMRPPRPGQANPITIDGSGVSGTSVAPMATSAFAKLMSSHAEDAAWATAVAHANSSRGRQSYERTCPFYKIMPGFFICVDAFRYGPVEGCRAYFLSHFHSDHYVGLTAKWSHGPIYCSKVTSSLVKTQLGTAAKWVVAIEYEQTVDVPGTGGVQVTMIPANHCPGSSLFLFTKTLPNGRTQRILHCGDFRACPAHVQHSLLRPETLDAVTGKTRQQKIDVCYLDTTYLNPRYSFPPQNDVIGACASLCAALDRSLRSGTDDEWDRLLGRPKNRSGGAGSFFVRGGAEPKPSPAAGVPASTTNALSILGKPAPKGSRLLVVCGTYSIGKERICVAIAQALGSKIYASPAKIRIMQQLDDPELAALMTSNPAEAQVHMQMLMEMRAETLATYHETYSAHFSRIVGFRPSGWNYRPSMANNETKARDGSSGAAVAAGAGLAPGSLTTTTLLHGAGWRTRFGMRDLLPQRGSTREAMCFGVPYSEHSSFRELALFVMALRIDKVVPTVNVGSEQSRRRMKAWLDRWMTERRKGGIVDVLSEANGSEQETARRDGRQLMWDGKDGKGGGAYW
ncbi:DNA repair protein pso2 [Grosmannia clavigera kw1407]|uniref:DNA repair protein pso2 n=1 Tax=Grosmannia clavigera (strain kw1407 / UAMH 11150) TaxID=655863 RepID=F0XDQ8_GROCL|nr:DNA repair protein pso2 [Grosmannia clavigera kw1407]EFX03971.1 DNA repair protein pso2 [Grosmannia clavigera kw1407]